MAIEDRLLKIENAVVTLSELAAKSNARTSSLEKYFTVLTELAVNASERMDTHLAWINSLGEAQANTEVRLAALADAQVNTEVKLAALADAQIRTETALVSLTARLDQLSSTVDRYIGGKS